MSDTKVTIYSTEFCGYCKIAKQYFDDNKIDYTEVDVTSDKDKQKEMIEKSGQMGVPVIIIEKDGKEEVLVGFQKDKLASILDIKE